MTFWDTILALILQTRQFLDNFSFRVVVDAYFANSTFINQMIDEDIHIITRWRKDGVGWDDPKPPVKGREDVPENMGYSINCPISFMLLLQNPH